MKNRFLCTASIIYIVGILIGLYLNTSIAFLLLGIFTIIQIIYIHQKSKQQKSKRQENNYLENNYQESNQEKNGHLEKKKAIIKTTILIAILLFAMFYIRNINQEYENLYKELEEKEITIEAVVISPKQEKEYNNIYKIEVQKIDGNTKYKGKKLILKVKGKKEDIQQGNLIEVKGKYERPSTSRNYGGFDYQEYLKTQNISGTIITGETIKTIKKQNNNICDRVIISIQNTIKENMKKLLPKETEDLCIGMMIGDKEDLSEEVKENFKNSNLTHILAISGAHISYVLIGLAFVLNKTGKRLSKIVTILFLIFFIALTNFTPSVMRASIMAILELIAGLVHRKSDIYQNLALSSFIILLINPYSILNQGFQLSFAGTIGIVYLNNKLSEYIKLKINNKILKNIIDVIIVTISANIIILPIMAYQFNTISLTFWISNILASPFIGIILIGSFITFFCSLIFFPIAKILSYILNLALYGLLLISKTCAQIPLSSILVKTPYITTILIYYIIIILWKEKYLSKFWNYTKNQKRFSKSKIIKIISISIIIILIFQLFIFKNQKLLKIYFIDVGQGDSCLIVTPDNKKILIDGGGSETGNFDVGEKTLIPYLLDRRITTLDYIIISHFDTDHIGGILTVLENLKVKTVIISKQTENSENYEKFKQIINNKKVKVLVVEKGNKITIEHNIYFQILWPNTNNLINENILNNNSIVCKLCYKNFSMLFTGDIEEIAEKAILQELNTSTNSQENAILKSTILKVGHHGSKTSSTKEFLEAVKPQIALIGVGKNNTFGHPSDSVIKRIEELRYKNL